MPEPRDDALRQKLALCLMPERRPSPLDGLIGLVVFTLLGCALLYWVLPAPGEQGIDDILAAHLRSRAPGRAIQVESADPRFVQTWLDSHLPLPLTLPDLSQQGYALIGARLDMIAEVSAACILYGRHDKLLDLCVWPRANLAPTLPESAEREGYWILSWRQKGAELSAISDLEREDIEEFRTLWTLPGMQKL